MRYLWLGVSAVLLLCAGQARAQSVTIYCGASPATSIPCGITSNPVVVTDTGSAGGLAISNSNGPDVTGNITASAQSVTTAGGSDPYPSNLVTVQGTYAGISLVFEGSDDGGVTYFPIACARRDGTSAPEAGATLLTNISRAWICPSDGYDTFRVRSSAYTSGTMAVRISTTGEVNIDGRTSGVSPVQVTPLGYQQMTSISAATSLPSIPANATAAFIDCEVSNVRWRDDGVAPTATVGKNLYVGSQFWYKGSLSALQVIQVSAGGICNVEYYQ